MNRVKYLFFAVMGCFPAKISPGKTHEIVVSADGFQPCLCVWFAVMFTTGDRRQRTIYGMSVHLRVVGGPVINL